ncbi:hypothetical protein GCM10023066_12140 [Nocardioides kongjuensis]
MLANDPATLYSITNNADGTISFTAAGATGSLGSEVNALAFNALDGYLYATQRVGGVSGVNRLIKIGQNGVVVTANVATLPDAVPGVSGTQNFIDGTVDPATGTLYLSANNVSMSTFTKVNLATGAVTTTNLSQTFSNSGIADWVFQAGFLWTVNDGGDLIKVDPATGVATTVKTNAIPDATTPPSGPQAYGGGFALGNGNIVFIDNGTGKAYQINMSSGTYNSYYVGDGPSTANNDATSGLGSPTDLVVGKCGPSQGTCKFPTGNNTPLHSYPLGQDPASNYVAGSTFTYTLTVYNDGPGLSSGSVVTDTLPTGTTYSSSSLSTCVASGSTVTCGVGQIAAGTSISFTITVNVASSTTGAVTNTATVLGNEAEVDTKDNSDTHTLAVQLSCAAGTIYGVNRTSPYSLLAINSGTGSSTGVATFNTPPIDLLGFQELNALAIAPGGTAAYAVSNYRTSAGTVTVQKYDPSSGAVTNVGTLSLASGLYIVGGAFDPTTNRYWLMTYNSLNGWYEFYAYDTATNTSLGRQFSFPWNTDLTLHGNGDLAFDATGRLYVLMSDGSARSQIRMFAPPLPSGDTNLTSSSGTLLTSPVGAVTVESNGIAFGADGYLYAQSLDGTGGQAVIRKIDPATGVVQSSVNLTNPDGTANTKSVDLASCAMPSTITLQKNIVGRKVATDQFDLSITGNGVSQNNTATTSGSTTGLQTNAGAVAGPVLVIPGKVYAITEAGASGANLANYSRSYECVNTLNNNVVVASGTTSSGSVTVPAASATGANIVCTFTNTPLNPSINIVKSSGSVTGPDASGVYTANYTVTVANSGNASGTYGPLVDTPAFDSDYTVQSASWAGQSTGSATGTGPFTLAPSGTSIGVGVTHTYNVAIKFKYTGTGVITACGGPGTGLFNSVAAIGETGPTTDNSACNTPPANINVTKTAGSVSGPDVAGNYTVTYSVKVINSGLSAGSYGALTDTPAFSANLVLTAASWTTSGAGAPGNGGASGAGPYALAPAGTTIAAGVTHTFALTITFHFSDNTVATVCGGPGAGLYNAVAVPSGQETSTTDNSACVEPPKRYDVFVRKVGKNAAGFTVSLAGSTWQLQADANGTPGAVITGGIQPVSGQTGEFKMSQLQPGTYWLTETKAPTGYQLLAQPIKFVVSATGVVTVASGGDTAISVGSTSGGQPEITVGDVAALTLPLAGGSGTKAFALLGGFLLLLTVLSLVLFRRPSSGASTGKRVRE